MSKLFRRYVRLQATTKGLLGGSRFWTVVWVVSATVGLAKRFLGDKPEIIYRTELRDRDSLVISSSPEAPVRVKR